MPTSGFLIVGDKKYNLKYGESYVVGRSASDYTHDIEINDESVDIKHCILDFMEPIPKIFDIKSNCGTFVDQERIPSCSMYPLKKSVNIQIGCVDATLELAIEGDSGFLEDRLSPQVKESATENKQRSYQLQQEENQASTASTTTTNLDHQFAIPTMTARMSKSRDNSRTNESLDSFSIPETQLPPKDALPQVDDDEDEDGFYIPETQDALTAVAVLNNYPRVAFENEDVNETVADFDKIPSSQFRICTQDFNGSGDELSNNSDDILANVPCSLVIPAIRHSTIHIDDVASTGGNAEEEKELSRLHWSKTTCNTSVPDGVSTSDNLTLPNQDQLEVPQHSSQCSTPDIFADNEPILDEMEKSLKENDPPMIVGIGIKQTHEIQKTSIKHASSTPINKTDIQGLKVAKSPLPPTQLFVLPKTKTDDTQTVDKQKSVSVIDDLPPTQVFQPDPPRSRTGNVSSLTQVDVEMQPTQVFQANPTRSRTATAASLAQVDVELQPTQVFQPAPAKTKTGNVLSSTLLDSAIQLSECSFKAKCNKLLDSDDDEMDEVVAPELVHKYRQSLENVKESKKTPPTKQADNFATPSQENKTNLADSDKMLPPKSLPTTTARDTPVVHTKKQNPESVAKYANIDDFLCTPDFLGREFAKEGNLQKQAEQNWKNQRKPLFPDEETPTKTVSNESDDSQDSFTDLITTKAKQENANEKLEKKLQPEVATEISNKPKLVEVAVRISRRRQSTMKQETTEKKSLHPKPDPVSKGKDDKNVKQRGRKKRSAPKPEEEGLPVSDRNDESSKSKQSKDSHEERSSRHKQRSERNTSQTRSVSKSKVKADAHSDEQPPPVKDKSESKGKKSNESQEEGTSKQRHRSDRKTIHNTNANNVQDRADAKLSEEKDVKRKTRRKSTTSSADKLSKPADEKGRPPPITKTDDCQVANNSKVSLDSSKNATAREENVPSAQKWKERRNLEVVLSKNGIKVHKIDSTKSVTKSDSEGSSRTRSKKKSEGDKLDVSKTNSEGQISASHALPDNKHKIPSKDEKESRKDKSNNTGSKIVKKEVDRTKTRNAVNKIEEEEEEKPLKRVTRLRSTKQIGPSPTIDQSSEPNGLKSSRPTPTADQSSEPNGLKSSRPTRSRTKAPKEPEEYQSSYDVTNISDRNMTHRPSEKQSGVQASSSGVKRKNPEEGAESKRLKSASSDSTPTNDRRAKQKPKIAMTMCDPRYQEVLEKHSGMHWVYTGNPKECDVLILEKGNRTYKLMVAIARGIPVVKLDWLKEVLKRKSTSVPMDEYIFDDPQFQERHQFVMKKSLSQAKTTSLFRGFAFMMTPNIRPSPSEMKDIVTCAGGTVLEEMPKQKQQIYLISHANDNQYWHQYRRSNSNVRIVTTEGVMASVMQQSDAPLIRSIIQ